MDMALEDGMGLPIPSVEHCICPTGYVGTSCEVSTARYGASQASWTDWLLSLEVLRSDYWSEIVVVCL